MRDHLIGIFVITSTFRAMASIMTLYIVSNKRGYEAFFLNSILLSVSPVLFIVIGVFVSLAFFLMFDRIADDSPKLASLMAYGLMGTIAFDFGHDAAGIFA